MKEALKEKEDFCRSWKAKTPSRLIIESRHQGRDRLGAVATDGN